MTGNRTTASRRVAVALALAAACGAPSRAHAQRETHAPLILQLPVTARTMAMGGLSAGWRDVEAVFGNPALVGSANATSITVGRYASGAATGQLVMGTTVGPLGVGVGVQLLDAAQRQPGAPLRSDVLTDEGRFPASNLVATVAAAMGWKGLRWGAAVRYLEARTADARGGAPSVDLGVGKELIPGYLVAGLALQHVGRAVSDEPRSALPTRISLGLAGAGYNLGKWVDIGAAAQLTAREDGRLFGSTGGEVALVPIEGLAVALRAGVRHAELRAQRPMTWGAGLLFDRLALDYGWEDMRGKGGAHRITLRLR